MRNTAHIWKHRRLGIWYAWIRDAEQIVHSTPHATHAEALAWVHDQIDASTNREHRDSTRGRRPV